MVLRIREAPLSLGTLTTHFPYLYGGGDRCEHAIHRSAKQRQGTHDGHRHQKDDQGVLHETLALFLRMFPPGRDHHASLLRFYCHIPTYPQGNLPADFKG